MSDDEARRLFRYVGGDEWRDYRAIMGVFAGTFFAELTPDEVSTRLGAAGHPLDPEVLADRVDRLRQWGNLTVSSAVGSPTSLADYYRRRNRYLITRAGQEVHEVVEGVLTRVDEVRDVSTGRLRALLDAIVALAAVDVDHEDPRAAGRLTACRGSASERRHGGPTCCGWRRSSPGPIPTAPPGWRWPRSASRRRTTGASRPRTATIR